MFNRKSIQERFSQLKQWKAFADRIRPDHRFSNDKLPPPPNYALPSSWAGHPDRADKSNFVPEQTNADVPETPLADVFYVHPTSFFGKSWNASLSNPKTKEIIDESFIPSQASVFNGSCRIFAPYYRQATFYSFLQAKRDGRKALEVAYEDIKAAFLYYMKHHNLGRPYFIASHSQGTLHIIRLLEEVIDVSEFHRNMVAAYVPGFRFPKAKVQQFQQLRVGASPTEFGTIMAWDTYLEGRNPHALPNRQEHYYRGKWKRIGSQPIVGVNPLNWQTGLAAAPASLNEGAVAIKFKEYNFQLADMSSPDLLGLQAEGLTSPFPEEVGTRLRKDGYLSITKPVHSIFRRLVLPNKNYHNYDYSLFYMNIRRNVAVRLEHYLNLR